VPTGPARRPAWTTVDRPEGPVVSDAAADEAGAGTGSGRSSPSRDRDRDRVELLVVRVGDRRHGVPVGRVDGIESVPDVVRVPRTPETVAGVARPRGETAVVVDAHALTGASGARPDGSDPRHRLVLFERDVEEGTPVGVVVDAVEETVTVSVDRLAAGDGPEADPSVVDPTVHGVVAATPDGPLPVVDVPRAIKTACGREHPP
jgi:chemotaxis signal transduction protein